MTKKYEYDVALSFAGEDRTFVEECAEILRSLNINVFYDDYEKETLWGKNLYSYLADVYKNKAKYAVIFISESYKKKRWTKHELEYITARKFEQDEEYILPVRLDNTSLDEIAPTIGFINGTRAFDVACSIAKKVNKEFDIETMLQQLKDYLPDYHIELNGTKVIFDCPTESFYAEYPLGLMMELYRQNLIFEAFILPSIVPN